jgi:hypothetical protein
LGPSGWRHRSSVHLGQGPGQLPAAGTGTEGETLQARERAVGAARQVTRAACPGAGQRVGEQAAGRGEVPSWGAGSGRSLAAARNRAGCRRGAACSRVVERNPAERNPAERNPVAGRNSAAGRNQVASNCPPQSPEPPEPRHRSDSPVGHRGHRTASGRRRCPAGRGNPPRRAPHKGKTQGRVGAKSVGWSRGPPQIARGRAGGWNTDG